MKKTILVISIFLFSIVSVVYSQNKNNNRAKAMASIKKNMNISELDKMAQNFNKEYLRNKKEVDKWLKKAKMKRYVHLKNGTVLWVEKIKNGYPVIYSTRNVIAAITTSTDKVQPGGSANLNLYGNYLGGMDIGLWDAGIPNRNHEAFVDQYNDHHLIIADTSSHLIIDDHATHIAGTLIGDDSNPSAKGMAWGAYLRAWDATNDLSEISSAINYADPNTPYLTISNHSYGPNLGWAKGLRNDPNNWYWTYDDAYYEDQRFGNYDSTAKNIDWIALNSQTYLMVRAVGNERGEGPIEFQDNYYYWDIFDSTWKSQLYTGQHPKDGGNNGYGCLPNDAVAKNILTVGAIDDIPNGYSESSDVKQKNTSFSSWGPTLDGRIKPDIVANGDNLYSSVYHNPLNRSQTGNNYYDYKSGTSMAAPNACGSILLLQEYYLKTHSNNYPLATTLKALVINSANPAGSSEGPDYKYGWGLLNTAGAAEIITEDVSEGINIQELSINNGQPVEFNVYSDGTKPIKATIVWNDPISTNNNVLSHDLDLRITDENGNSYLPFVLDPDNPDAAATTGDDTKNNVEKIIIDNPSYGKYTIKISAKGNFSQNFSVVVSNVTAQPQNMQLTVKQFFEDGTTQTDSIARYENSHFVNYPSGYVFSDVNNQAPVTLRATLKTLYDNQSILEKFHDWNDNQKYVNHNDFNLTTANTTIKSNLTKTYNVNLNISAENATTQYGSVELKDPWLRDDNSDPKGTRNRGLNAIWHSYSSPYQITISGEHQGVFLGQGYNPNNGQWNPPYYTVKAVSPQTININGRNHKFYFQNWEASPGGSAAFQHSDQAETPVMFNNAGATVKAVMKGTQLSNYAEAYKHNGQQKVIRTSDGILWMVYESMGKIWLEKSTDNGATWDLANDRNPLPSFGFECKSPSILLDVQHAPEQKNFYVAYQLKSSYNETQLKLLYFINGNYSFSFEGLDDPMITSDDMMPVMAKSITNNSGELVIVWKGAYDEGEEGLYYYYINHEYGTTNGTLITEEPEQISNTSSSSVNPTIIVEDKTDLHSPFHLAWQEGPSQIRYEKLSHDNNGVTQSNYAVISSGSGFSNNQYPSITMKRYQNSYYPVVSWVGINPDKDYSKVIFRDLSQYGTWGFFRQVGSDVEKSFNRRAEDDNYVIAWSEEISTNKYTNRFIKNSDMYQIYNLDTKGKLLQISGGSTMNDMYAVSYYNWEQPYEFKTSNSLGGSMSKTTVSPLSFGRGCVVYNGRAEFYFIIGDINVDGENIDFKALKNPARMNSKNFANNILSTKSFKVNDRSTLNYSILYGITDTTAAMNLLKKGRKISFKLELVDAKTGKVLDSYDKVEFDLKNLKNFEDFSYKINMKGIGEREVRLKLTVENNFKANYAVSEIYNDRGTLGKSNPINLSYKGVLEIKDYSLEQNYPNPFNPSTRIKYQIPKNGKVTIKVYDMLGREVKTLVNEFKEKGRYEVTFDGENLSSGIYICRMKADKYSSSVKMLLIK